MFVQEIYCQNIISINCKKMTEYRLLSQSPLV